MAQINEKVGNQIKSAADAESASMRQGATESLTIEAASARGYRAGRQLGAFATETTVAKDLGFESQRAMRQSRREDPAAFLSLLIG